MILYHMSLRWGSISKTWCKTENKCLDSIDSLWTRLQIKNTAFVHSSGPPTNRPSVCLNTKQQWRGWQGHKRKVTALQKPTLLPRASLLKITLASQKAVWTELCGQLRAKKNFIVYTRGVWFRGRENRCLRASGPYSISETSRIRLVLLHVGHDSLPSLMEQWNF